MKVSRNLGLQAVDNIRDLGGMVTKEGKIVLSNRLIRSCDLSKATEQDCETLNQYPILKIYDFRSELEIKSRPDAILKQTEYVHLPILEHLNKRTSHISEQPNFFQEVETDSQIGYRLMMGNYDNFAKSEYSYKQYHKFIEDIIQTAKQNPTGAMLWHCTSGKDRAGFATIIVEEILGMDKDVIYQDYLNSNIYLKDEANKLKVMFFADRNETISQQAQQNINQMIDDMVTAKKVYLDYCYQCIEEKFGGFENYLEFGLQLSKQTQQEFRDLFLIEGNDL